MKSKFVLLTLAILPLAAFAQQRHGLMKGAFLYKPDDVKWQDAPPSLLKGAKIALLEGDPAKEGPFVVRFKFPDEYKVLPHVHPKRERVTVLQGTLYVGMGE